MILFLLLAQVCFAQIDRPFIPQDDPLRWLKRDIDGSPADNDKKIRGQMEREDLQKELPDKIAGFKTVTARLKELSAREGKTNDEKSQLAQETVKTLNEQQAMGDRIIRDVIKAYEIRPTAFNGQIQQGPFVGTNVPWHPKFTPFRDTERDSMDYKGNSFNMEFVGNNYDAITWADGAIQLTSDSFESAGILAATLLYETKHFEQLIDRASPSFDARSLEVSAQNAVLGEWGVSTKAEHLYLSKAEKKTIADRFAKKMKMIDVLPDSEKKGRLGPLYGEPQAINIKGEIDFDIYVAKVRRLIDHVEEKEAAQKKYNEEWDEREKFDKQRAADVYPFLAKVAKLACADTDEFLKQMDQVEVSHPSARFDLLLEIMVKDDHANGLGPCQYSVLLGILSANDVVSKERIVDMVKEYERTHSSFKRDMGKIADGASAEFNAAAAALENAIKFGWKNFSAWAHELAEELNRHSPERPDSDHDHESHTDWYKDNPNYDKDGHYIGDKGGGLVFKGNAGGSGIGGVDTRKGKN